MPVIVKAEKELKRIEKKFMKVEKNSSFDDWSRLGGAFHSSDAGILYFCIGASIGSSIICASRLLPLSLVPALQWNALVADSSLYHVIAASKWKFDVRAEFLCPFQLVSFPRFQLSLAMYFLNDQEKT